MAYASTIICDRLTLAFRALRSAGFVARQNFQCCSGCASCEIAGDVAAKGKWIPGCVFTTKQDMSAESLRLIDRARGEHGIWLKFGPVEADGVVYGFDTITVGRVIVEACEAVGLEVAWDGTAATCINVKVPVAERATLRR